MLQLEFGYSSWYDDALCKQMDPALWFPNRGEGRSKGYKAKQICKECPVLEQCRRDVMIFEEHNSYAEGIYGGLTLKERQAIRDAKAAEESRPKDVKRHSRGWRARSTPNPNRED